MQAILLPGRRTLAAAVAGLVLSVRATGIATPRLCGTVSIPLLWEDVGT